jgi:DNA-binding SARP family transcriptional activator
MIDRVFAMPPPRLVVLTAPAGYGKSTFVRAYARRFSDAAVCDCEALRDADELGRRIVDALAAGSAELAIEIARIRLARGSDARAQMDVLLEFWGRASVPSLIAFENADGLRGVPGAHELVERLVESAPAGRTLAFCLRRPLPAAFARALGADGVATIGAHDLELSEDQVIALAAGQGVVIADAREIARLSAGWPVVVRLLIAMAATGRFDRLGSKLDDVAFDELYDYLAQEVVVGLPATVADALVAAVAIRDAQSADIAGALGDRFDAVTELRLQTLPFVTRDARGAYTVHELVRSMVARRFPERIDASLEAALTAHERAGNVARAAQIALAQGDVRRAARVLDRLPTYVRAPTALPQCEHIVARLAPGQIAAFPSLWIATMPFRRFSVDLTTYLGEARRVYYCLHDDADARLRTDVLLHLAAALYQSALFEEAETVLREALETYAREPSGERAAVLSFVTSLRGLQGRFAEARALRAEIATIRRPDFLSDLGLHYVDAHEAFARGRYERGIAIVDESLRRMQEANLPLYVAFTATNGAIFAWANGDDERFARFLAHVEDVMVPGIERGFASFLAAARGRTFVANTRFEAPVMLAMAHLFRMGFAQDRGTAADAAGDAAREADRCSDPYLQVLSHAACLLLAPERGPGETEAMLGAARRIEAPELLAAATAVARGADAAILAPFVASRVLRERAARPAGADVRVFAGCADVSGREVRLAGKELELLLYLALAHARGAVARTAITEAIWPEIDEPDDAANNLRVTLSRLRRKLGDEGMILRSDNGYRLSSAVMVDVRQAEALVREPSAGQQLTKDRRAALAAVFAAVETGLPARFERFAWFAPHRLRLRELALAVGTLLARDALARAETGEALRYAHALVALDPLDEIARRLALDAYAIAGEWSAARRELDGYAALLHDELDAEPSAELFTLVDAAKERHHALTSAAVAGGSPPSVPGRSRHD